MKDILYIEDPYVYDGWIAKRHEDGTIELRDFYVTQSWSKKKKAKYLEGLYVTYKEYGP